MPYIKPEQRKYLDVVFPMKALIESEGELNYLITRLLFRYESDKIDDYKKFNAVIGALECAKQEYYRRVVVPYEEKKIKQNGDIAGYPERGLA